MVCIKYTYHFLTPCAVVVVVVAVADTGWRVWARGGGGKRVVSLVTVTWGRDKVVGGDALRCIGGGARDAAEACSWCWHWHWCICFCCCGSRSHSRVWGCLETPSVICHPSSSSLSTCDGDYDGGCHSQPPTRGVDRVVIGVEAVVPVEAVLCVLVGGSNNLLARYISHLPSKRAMGERNEWLEVPVVDPSAQTTVYTVVWVSNKAATSSDHAVVKPLSLLPLRKTGPKYVNMGNGVMSGWVDRAVDRWTKYMILSNMTTSQSVFFRDTIEFSDLLEASSKLEPGDFNLKKRTHLIQAGRKCGICIGCNFIEVSY